MTGSQVQRNITNANNVVLYLSAANSATDGKSVSTTGYIYGYNTTKANFNYQMVSIEENTNPDTPTLSVSATSLNWSATESGQSSAKQVTVTLNSSVDEDNYNIEGSSNDWVVTPYSGLSESGQHRLRGKDLHLQGGPRRRQLRVQGDYLHAGRAQQWRWYYLYKSHISSF